jgi:hypothetical protein
VQAIVEKSHKKGLPMNGLRRNNVTSLLPRLVTKKNPSVFAEGQQLKTQSIKKSAPVHQPVRIELTG